MARYSTAGGVRHIVGDDGYGWYLYDDRPGGFFGEYCSKRILEAVDAANLLISGQS